MTAIDALLYQIGFLIGQLQVFSRQFGLFVAPAWSQPLFRPVIIVAGMVLTLISPVVTLNIFFPYLLPAAAVYFFLRSL